MASVRRRTLAAVLCAGTIVVFGWFYSDAIGRLKRFDALATEYPLVSVAHRLRFEAGRSMQQPTVPSSQEQITTQLSSTVLPELSATVEQTLSAQEKRDEYGLYRWHRAWALTKLHDASYRQFIASSGFGVSRMHRLSRYDIVLEALPPMTVPFSIQTATSDPKVHGASDPADLAPIHTELVYNFIAPDRIGYVQDRDHVAGFMSHRFSKMEQYREDPSEDPSDEATPGTWHVNRLELVSLLRHDEPVVYVAETLPQMDQLETIPYRPLDLFERVALPKLNTEHDVITEDAEGATRMLGAVRAGNDCLECHSGDRGRLLGAFSYALTLAE